MFVRLANRLGRELDRFISIWRTGYFLATALRIIFYLCASRTEMVNQALNEWQGKRLLLEGVRPCVGGACERCGFNLPHHSPVYRPFHRQCRAAPPFDLPERGHMLEICPTSQHTECEQVITSCLVPRLSTSCILAWNKAIFISTQIYRRNIVLGVILLNSIVFLNLQITYLSEVNDLLNR